jgi:hypothetical protein
LGLCAQSEALPFFEAKKPSSGANHKPKTYSQANLARDLISIATMAAIGSLVFCTDCGNLLENNTSRKTYLNCEVCGAQNKGMPERQTKE